MILKCDIINKQGVRRLFNIGDTVVYGAQGVCKIDTVQEKQIGKQAIKYYVLKPVFNENTSVFVPIENAVLTAKMQSILTLSQAKELINEVPNIKILKNTDESHKRELYKNTIASGDHKALISLIKTIVAERERRREAGKKLNMNDEQTLCKAETLLYSELAIVYGVELGEAKNLIKF